MKIKCEFCGSWIDESDAACPNCNGINARFKRQGDGVPRTIEELKQWALSHNLPLDQMRTFIGENYTGAKAFGIYKDEVTGHFIVYKNKADGTRAVRYEGPDEAYAVNELYLKMKERVIQQKSAAMGAGSGQMPQRGSGMGNRMLKRVIRRIVILYLAMMLVGVAYSVMVIWRDRDDAPSHKNGYYSYEGTDYYLQNNSWYYFDYDADDWRYESEVPDGLSDDTEDYYKSGSYDYDAVYSDFSNSNYYEPEKKWSSSDRDDDSYSSSDWDSNSSWDSNDSWSSGSDNWDSDW